MPSFSKMGVFPAGYFRATTQWLLRERRDVAARIDTLQTELLRIGEVKMAYQPVQEGDDTRKTYRRIGFTVTVGSSLARLVQAYIAQGGNPYDISHFLHPDTTAWVETSDGKLARQEEYPGGGFVAPKSAAYNEPLAKPLSDDGSAMPEETGYGAYPGGMMDTHRYNPGRLGGRLDRGSWDSNTVNRVMHDVRKWANKEIKTRLQDMEWRVIKLSDLAEQLTQERDHVLMEAFAGTLNGLPESFRDDAQYDSRRLMQVIIQDFYGVLYETTPGGVTYGFRANVAAGGLLFMFPDVPEDADGPMG
jgi:hypothetical protein